MGRDIAYINGVVASYEKNLLKDKLLRMCELSLEDAYRTLLEGGFGQGAVNEDGAYGFEKLIVAEEGALDAFITDYAPTKAESYYFLAPRDFHNAKALLKAEYLGCEATDMLASAGIVPIADLKAKVHLGDTSGLDKHLANAILQGKQLLQEEADSIKLGMLFEREMTACLLSYVKRGFLKTTLRTKVDMLNILTCLRAKEGEADAMIVGGGTLTRGQLSLLQGNDGDKIMQAFANTPYARFVASGWACKQANVPFTECEKWLASVERRALDEHKYELAGKEPFLYYVFRKRAEHADVRVIFVCLQAGMDDVNIKKRLRAIS